MGLVDAVNNLKIPTKLIMAFGALVLTICAVIGAIFLQLSAAQQAGADTDRITSILDSANQAQIAMLEQSNAVRALLLTKEARYAENYRAEKASFFKSIEKMKELVRNAEARAMWEQSVTAAKEWQEKVGDVQAQVASDPGTMEQAMETVRNGLASRLYRVYRDIADKGEQTQRKVLASVKAKDDAAQDSIKLVLLTGGAVAIAFALGFGFLLARTIGAPVTAMTKVMNQLAAGDYEAAIPGPAAATRSARWPRRRGVQAGRARPGADGARRGGAARPHRGGARPQ
ncbi:CHASE3 domain-containing protein [Micromonospora sp. STR1s_5]|nr:CHASE3 domain-containing protein [Micromonospora sp. STR1s_5]